MLHNVLRDRLDLVVAQVHLLQRVSFPPVLDEPEFLEVDDFCRECFELAALQIQRPVLLRSLKRCFHGFGASWAHLAT